MRQVTRNYRIRMLLLGISSLGLISALPLILGPGLNNPEPIGAYLNGTFPAEPALQNAYEVAFENLTFDSPLTFAMVPNQNRIIVGQRDGKVYWFENDPQTSVKNFVVDLSDIVGLVWDGGLLGLIPHPEYGTNGNRYFYTYYSTEDSNSEDFPDYFSGMACNTAGYWGNFLILERFEVDETTLTKVPGSSEILIKRRMYGGAHRGGGIEFGNDGFLYLATGDNSKYSGAQDIADNLDGGVLRIDVDMDPSKSHAPVRTMPEDLGYPDEISGNNYWIPNDNPFLSPDGSLFEEYYTLGNRSPHRMTKDPVTGTIYIGEVGSNKFEEVNVLSKGKNYGWPVWEGSVSGIDGCGTMYNGMPHELPLLSFPRAVTRVVIGGYVYRGTEIPELYGKYICADYGPGEEIWSVDTQTGDYTLLGNFNPANIISFGQDHQGEIYMLKLGDSTPLYKLTSPEISYDGIPQTLSATGAFSNLSTLEVIEGLIPYDLVDPFWSDGAIKSRWMAIPNDGSHDTPEEQIQFSEDGVWNFPIGTVLVKHFDLPIDDTNPSITRKIETRFSIKDQNGSFYFLTYNWNEAQTEATLQEVSLDEPVAITTTTGGTRYQDWHFPSNTECITCHKEVLNGTLGPRTRYLNKDYTYDKTGLTANQLVTLSHLGILDQPIDDNDVGGFLTHKSIYDSNASLDDRARSYMDLNCAYCHRPGTGNRAEFDLRLINNLEETGLLTAGVLTPLGIPGEEILVPGDASKSILYHRLASTDPNIMMPPLAKAVVDEDGVALIQEWINQLGEPPNEGPVAVLTANPTSGEAPLQVNFTGSNSTDDNAIVSYNWDFGDGNLASTPDPIHTYTTAGSFEAQLTVSDEQGLTDTAMITIDVAQPNESPIARISASPTSGDAPLLVNFIGSNSTDDKAVVSYAWDFDDGNTSDVADPTHTFNATGNYTVQLTVSDQEGLTDTTTQVIEVGTSNQAPIAMLTASPTSGEAPLSVVFTGSLSTDDNGVVSYNWDFGDGNSSTTADPVHIYSAAGSYLAQLTVSDQEGLTDTTSITIDVYGPNQAPVAVISADPTSGEVPLLVNFSGSQSTDDKAIVGYSWDFGDGNGDTTADPAHTYDTDGSFLVQLTVSDEEGLSDTTSLSIEVIQIDGEMSIILMENPPKSDISHIRILNRPSDMTVRDIYCHDISGRLIRIYNPQSVAVDSGYDIPIFGLENGVYLITVNMEEGDPIVLKLIVRD